MQVTTQSGTVYEFTKTGGKVRRLVRRLDTDPESEFEREKRELDGRWRELFSEVEPSVGSCMVLPYLGDGSIDVHITSPVVAIKG